MQPPAPKERQFERVFKSPWGDLVLLEEAMKQLNPAAQVTAMATSGGSGQNAEADGRGYGPVYPDLGNKAESETGRCPSATSDQQEFLNPALAGPESLCEICRGLFRPVAPSEIEPQSGETPRTDKNYIRGFEALTITKDEDQWVRADFARTLERELAEAKAGREFQSAQVDRIVVEEVAATKAAKERAKKAEAEVAALKRDAALWEARAYQQAFMADGETAERYWAKIDKRIASNPPAEQEPSMSALTDRLDALELWLVQVVNHAHPVPVEFVNTLREIKQALSAPSATLPSVDAYHESHWVFRYDDGSIFDEIFDEKRHAENYATGKNADLVEGATPVEVRLVPVSALTHRPEVRASEEGPEVFEAMHRLKQEGKL